MDEGTIYNPQSNQQNPGVNNPPTAPVSPTPQPPSPAPLPQSNQFAPPSSPSPIQPPAPPPVPEKKRTFSGKIVKILLGVFAVFIILMVLLVLASKLTHRSSTPSGPVTLTYWGLVDESKVDAQIKGFETENPQITINYVKEDPSDYTEKLKVRIPNGNGPDVYMLDKSWMPILTSYLLPLPQSVIDQTKFDSNYYPVAKEDLISNGGIYAFPLNIDTLALFINSSLLPSEKENNTPKTWQEFVDLAQGATKRDDQGKITAAGAGIGTFDNIKSAQYLLALLFAQNGVNFSKINDFQDRISQALTFYTDFAQVENSVWDENQDNSLLSFINGTSAMYFGFASDIDQIKTQKPDLLFRVVPMPQLAPESPVNITSYLAQGISNGTSHQKEALLFTKYLIDHPANLGEISANKNSKVSGDLNLSVFQDQATSGVSSPYGVNPSEKSLNAKLVESLRKSVNSILNGGPADESAGQIINDYSDTISSLQKSSASK